MDGATFNPAGNVIALQDSELVTFAPTPRPARELTAKCLAFSRATFFTVGPVTWRDPAPGGPGEANPHR
jgi:hypothetical protein